MTYWEESDFTVQVLGPNTPSVGQVIEDKHSKYVDKIQPVVAQSEIKMLPIEPVSTRDAQDVLIDGRSALVTLTFNERVTQPRVTLNGQSVAFDEQPMMEDISANWVGTIAALDLPVNTATSSLNVSGFEDTAVVPNEGVVFNKDVAHKPLLSWILLMTCWLVSRLCFQSRVAPKAFKIVLS